MRNLIFSCSRLRGRNLESRDLIRLIYIVDCFTSLETERCLSYIDQYHDDGSVYQSSISRSEESLGLVTRICGDVPAAVRKVPIGPLEIFDNSKHAAKRLGFCDLKNFADIRPPIFTYMYVDGFLRAIGLEWSPSSTNHIFHCYSISEMRIFGTGYYQSS